MIENPEKNGKSKYADILPLPHPESKKHPVCLAARGRHSLRPLPHSQDTKMPLRKRRSRRSSVRKKAIMCLLTKIIKKKCTIKI